MTAGVGSSLDGRPDLPLTGIRVLDFTVIFAGPSATMLLADWGAEVIRVESFTHYSEHTRGPRSPEAGFLARMQAMKHPLYTYVAKDPGPRPWNRYAAFNAHARNKRSVDLDIATDAGRAAFLRLVALSDVVVENNAPGLLDKLRLGYEELRCAREDIILVRMPAFGLSGPYRDYKANGVNVDGATGHAWMRGYADRDPTAQGTVVAADAITGVSGALATVLALIHRRRTGKGQLVEVPMADAFLACVPEGILEFSMNGANLAPRGHRSETMVPHGCFPCKGDDRWITVAIRNEDQWKRLCALMGFDDWLGRAEFGSLAGRRAHEDAIEERIAGWTREHDARELMLLLQQHGIPAAAVLDEAMVYEDPHVQARGAFEPLQQEDCGTHLYQGPWWLMDGERPALRLPPCRLGEHNRYVADLLGDEVDC